MKERYCVQLYKAKTILPCSPVENYEMKFNAGSFEEAKRRAESKYTSGMIAARMKRESEKKWHVLFDFKNIFRF